MPFDFITHKRNRKGKVISFDPYRMKITKEGTKIERPPNSGNWFHPNGEPMEVVAKVVQEIKPTVAAPKVEAKESKIVPADWKKNTKGA